MRFAPWFISTAWSLIGILMSGSTNSEALAGQVRELRVGMVPNLMQSQALVTMDLSFAGQCWYKQRLPGVTLQWLPFSSSDQIIEAMQENKLDIAYIAPSPLLENLESGKDNVRVLSGAMRGGSALVVHQTSNLTSATDLKGRRIATPKTGNAQDIACRVWLMDAGLNIQISGGDVSLVPVANPDQLTLFASGHVDGVWTLEPWVSRLEDMSGAWIFHEERTDLTTVLVANKNIIQEDPIAVDAFVQAHEDLTQWIQQNAEEARRRIVSQLTRMDRRPFPPELVDKAWRRLVFDTHVCLNGFKDLLQDARRTGFIKKNIYLDKLFVNNFSPDCSLSERIGNH